MFSQPLHKNQAKDTLQDIMRCIIRDDPKAYACIYVSSTNTEYIEIILQSIPGIQVNYIYEQYVAPIRSKVEQFILEYMKDQISLKKSLIRKECNISSSSWTDLVKSKTCINFLMQHNIINNKFSLTKIPP